MAYSPKWVWATAVAILIASFLAGCVQEAAPDASAPQVITETVEIIQRETVPVTRVVTETIVLVVTPTPASAPPKELVVCLTAEPDSLYPYAPSNGSAQAGAAVAVRHALFDSLITNLTYDYQPTNALVKLPSLEDGDAVLYPITVAAGERVVDAEGNVVVLQNGVRVRNAEGEIVSFDGSSLTMSQLAVTFQLQPLLFSDGAAVTADDSVYSFELNADPDASADKFKVNRTARYRALDDLTVEWVGLPGFLDPTYFTNIWTPLPRHLWGTLTADELLEAEISARAPVGHGPFVVTSWLPGDRIELVKNEFYYQPGYPKLDSLTFKFIPNANQLIARLLSGQCDVGIGFDLEQGPILLEAEQTGVLTAHFAASASFEHIDFNIEPLDGRTRWFTDERVRHAFALCTNRAAMIESLLYGRAELMPAYIPASHPLYDADQLRQWPYDPAAGAALLEEAGFTLDEDGLRTHPVTGEPFRVSLGTNSGNALRAGIGQQFQADMRDCGVAIVLEYQPASQWFAAGPEGDLFGRRYDLALFAWLIGVQPACQLYAADRIPGPPNMADENGDPLYPAGWGGDNNSGWRNEPFTAACQTARHSLPGTAVYQSNHQEALRIFSEELPIIPLFTRLKLAAARPDLRHFQPDPTERSELYNLWQFEFADRP